MCSLVLPGCGWVCCQAGFCGGGAPDAGSSPSLREFPHGGADACTPRQGVTLLYGPSICTRSVQMDLRRNQVRRPFPTPGSGTLWVSGESLRDRRVSCLPRWTVCPTRGPSQDRNRSTCRGKCSWSGPLATSPGRGHLGPLANGPGRNPPYCLRSGGADTDTGGGPEPLRSGTSPASFAGSCHPAPPPVRCAVGPCLLAFFPRGVPLSRAPCPASWLLPCPVCPCRLPLLWCVGVLGFFVFFYPSTARHSSLPPAFRSVLCPPPCPLAVSSLSSPLSWVGGGEGGWGGGGVLAVRPLAQARRKRGASTRRGTCPSAGGGGLPCGSRRRPSYPAFAPPVPPPLGLARRVLPTGTVVWSVPHPLSAASPPCRFVLGGGGGGGGRCPPLPGFIPHPWGGGGVWGGGSLVVIPSLHACRRHDASTAQSRGAAPVPLQGGGHALWLPSSPFLPCVRSPGGPPAGACTARALYGHGRVVRPAPSRRCLPTLPLCPRGGGRFSPPPTCIPHPWGGGGVWGGGGGALVVFPPQHARRRHEASMAQTRGAALVPLQGGGLAVCHPSSPLLPCVRTPGGAEVCGGGGGHVAGTTQARRKHGVRHLAAAGGGGFSFGPSRPSPWYGLRTPGSPAAVAPWR